MSSSSSTDSDLSSDFSDFSDASDLSSGLSDLSSDFSDLSSDFSDLSSQVSDLSSNLSDMSSGSSDMSSQSDESSSSSSSSSSCDLEISVYPEEICCDGVISGYASCERLFELITVTLPDGTSRSGQGSVYFNYVARTEDCGTTVVFVATSANCTSAAASAKVIKAEFESASIPQADTFWQNDIENPGYQRFGVIVDLTVKVRFTPAPSVAPPYEVRINQWGNGYSGWLYEPGKNVPINPDQVLIGPDGNLSLEESSYNSDTGVLTLKANDTPGRPVSQQALNIDAFEWVKADFKAADYIQVKCGDGEWQTIGKIVWHWIGDVKILPPGAGEHGGVPASTGSSSNETPRTPTNP